MHYMQIYKQMCIFVKSVCCGVPACTRQCGPVDVRSTSALRARRPSASELHCCLRSDLMTEAAVIGCCVPLSTPCHPLLGYRTAVIYNLQVYFFETVCHKTVHLLLTLAFPILIYSLEALALNKSRLLKLENGLELL